MTVGRRFESACSSGSDSLCNTSNVAACDPPLRPTNTATPSATAPSARGSPRDAGCSGGDVGVGAFCTSAASCDVAGWSSPAKQRVERINFVKFAVLCLCAAGRCKHLARVDGAHSGPAGRAAAVGRHTSMALATTIAVVLASQTNCYDVEWAETHVRNA